MYVQYVSPYKAVKQIDVQPGRPYLPGMKSERLEMRVTAEWLAKVDDWRRRQPIIPTRTEAVRTLVELALQAGQGAAAAPEPRQKQAAS